MNNDAKTNQNKLIYCSKEVIIPAILAESTNINYESLFNCKK